MELRDKVTGLVRRWEREAREIEQGAEAQTDERSRDFLRGRMQGIRDVCYALRVALGVSKIGDL